MKPKVSLKMKRYIDNYISTYNKEIKKIENPLKYGFTTKEVIKTILFLSQAEKRNHSTLYKNLSDDLLLSYLGIASISYLSVAVCQEDSQKPISKDFISEYSSMNPNFMFMNMLGNISNNALAIVKLIETGLDTQARALVRVLAESIFITIYVITDQEAFWNYYNVKDTDEAKNTWFKYFRYAKLKNKLEVIENKVGFPQNLVNELVAMRDYIYKEYSSIIHSYSISSNVGSYAVSFDDEFMNIAIGGKASFSSKKTIHSLNWLLFYFSLMTKGIFQNIYHFKPPGNNEIWRMAVPLRECYIKVYFNVTYNEELESYSMNVT
ncbi:hypothetical protein [Paenibacillus fonticola]|uniref:hypothetical protein n=1 Tax=Paenibacillus fonticola TaxID=379896 RepID=UPI00035D4022|nr:hypothetical protein [Paenibacillus fonticola]